MQKSLFVSFIFLALFCLSVQQRLVGGKHKIENDELLKLEQNDIFNQVQKLARDTYRAQNNGELGELISVETQVVAGTNYHLTFRTNNGEHKVTVFSQPWTNTLEIVQHQFKWNPEIINESRVLQFEGNILFKNSKVFD